MMSRGPAVGGAAMRGHAGARVSGSQRQALSRGLASPMRRAFRFEGLDRVLAPKVSAAVPWARTVPTASASKMSKYTAM